MFFLCCNCGKFGASEVFSLIQIIVGVVAIFLAVYIPKKLSWEQMYTQLLTEYYSYDFAAAVQGIVFFFYEDCDCDFKKVKKKYVEKFNAQFERNVTNPENYKFSVPNDQNLHFQRRLLTQFYCLLDQCARSKYIGKNRVQRDFTTKEANLLKILYYMNIAAESDEIYMDISTDDRLTPHAKGINAYIKHVYEILRNSKPYMR